MKYKQTFKRGLTAFAAATWLAATSTTAHAAAAAMTMEPVVSGKAHDALFSVAFSQSQGIAVGAAGAILDTADGGKTWKPVAPSPTQLSLLGVDVQGSDALAVGQMGLILKRDANKAWKTIASGTEERLFSVSMNTRGVAAIVGSFGTVLKSKDGGATWAAVAPDWTAYTEDGAQPHLYAVQVDASGAVIIAGEFGLILRLPAGQTAWQLLHKGDASIFALDIRDDGIGYAVGQSGAALRTADGGSTWSALTTGSDAILLGVRSAADGSVIASGMRDMVSSRDDGRSWTHITAGDAQSAWYAGIGSPAGGGALLAVGHTGRIVRLQAP